MKLRKQKPSKEFSLVIKYDRFCIISVGLYFGIVTCGAGLIGVLLGSEIARRYVYLIEKMNVHLFFFSYRKRNDRGDPIVCGVAVLLSLPFLFCVLILSKDNLIITWICIFIAETLLCSNWALISDMLMVEL
jgi:hypothetical protein